jgi:hypothetical protein
VRASSSNGDFVSIERVEVDEVGLRLFVEVRQGGFAGRSHVWIEIRAWQKFVDSLTRLERDRRGEATVESMSPGEFRLIVRSIDSVGHVAVDGLLGKRGRPQTTTLSFSAIEFDPTLLREFLRAAREMSNREDPLQVSGDIVNTPRSGK